MAAEVWGQDPDRADRVLAQLGLARSRSHAAELIAGGTVLRNGAPVQKPSEKILSEDALELTERSQYVSRAAQKLVTALDVFNIDPSGLLALDVGASTGGFTQVLRERGAREVIALDVGHDQLAPEVRGDPGVRVIEGCNARYLDANQLRELSGTEELPQLVVGDVSFISLTLILPAIATSCALDARWMWLVKPQFEVGREHVRQGVVRDPVQHSAAIWSVMRTAAEVGWNPAGIAPSPIRGQHGNREYLVTFSPSAAPDLDAWENSVIEVTQI